MTHPTLDKLKTLKFTGMAAALADQMAMENIDQLSFEERLGSRGTVSSSVIHADSDAHSRTVFGLLGLKF